MKVIIFGGSGFIGTHYKTYLRGFNNISILSFDLEKDEETEYLDVRNTFNIDSSFCADDIIINLAAVHTTPGHTDHEYFETNIKGAENVCEFADRKGIQNIIFTSSIAPYGASEDLKSECTLPTPNTPYGISKLVAEHIHKEWAAKDSSRKLIILRPGVVFGKGENGNFTRLAKAIQKGVFFYPGRRDTIKACIYVKDLVRISWKLMEDKMHGVHLYNFAYEPAYTIQDIAEAVAKTLDKSTPKIVLNAILLRLIAFGFKSIGLGGLGIHPDRVKKLMLSTNISGRILKSEISSYHYTLESALKDWLHDNKEKGLF